MWIITDLEDGKPYIFTTMTKISRFTKIPVSTIKYNWANKKYYFCVIDKYKISKINVT